MQCDKRCKKHDDAEPVLMVNPEGSHHYGKWVCSVCEKYITHAKSPKTNDGMLERQKAIREWLLAHEFLEGDLEELLPLYHLGHLNLVQKERYARYIK